MGFVELFIIAVGLSMDAFAVSVCKGLSMRKMSWKSAVVTGLYFGGFQALMPVLGFFLGYRFRGWVEEIDHWIAFILLALIGISMLHEAFGQEKELDASFGVKAMLPLAVATSIDAFAVGVSFAFLNVAIAFAACFIGVTTFALSFAGIRVGNVFGKKYEAGAEITGGVILILMGIKILLEHLGILF